ncbi:MAG TPA: cyclopropane fatty acyl phospholipid synthase [Gammaproteobacteria bacterium]|nr:cyclopropane fatty acyl phospholipid synthase [Gammaproteobacteria bacterium]
MALSTFKHRVVHLLEGAGVSINGPHPWDIQVHNDHFYGRVIAHGSLGLGESYMQGWWDARDLDGSIYRLLMANLEERVLTLDTLLTFLHARFFNLQKPARAFDVGRRHYDMGNDLYKHMLGKRLVYSCGYWNEADNLDAAQEAKLELVFRKLGLKPGMRVLDIGCGWGEALKLAVERYGITGVGITVSEQQAEYARAISKGLPIEIRLQDYRLLGEQFDRIFSIGMFEHVGVKNYPSYMRVVRRCLKEDGLFLLHTIGGNKSVHDTDPWIAKYIFPNSMLPSIKQIAATTEGLFVMEDWHNFSVHYDKTLLAWRRNFENSWDELKHQYNETFQRMWYYYLSISAASFRARKNQLWQIVFSPNGVPGGYLAAR